jgi:hypothetical protein
MILGYKYLSTYTLISEGSIQMPSKLNCVPGIAIFSLKQIDFFHDEISISEIPLTAIESVYQPQSDDEILAKLEKYFFAGVQSCWLVQPSIKSIYV